MKCENISVSYGDFKALDNFSHDFKEGNIYCILGPNGCGKTTLLKAIVEDNWRSGEISYVAQETTGVIGLTVYEYISLGRYNPGKFYSRLSGEDIREIDEAMRTLEIEELKDRIFDTLSGGEKQRVTVARAIAQNTPWILLDEPSSNMDIRHNTVLMDILKKLKEQGKSVIIVLHDINMAAMYADECIFMKNGKLVVSGNPQTVMTEKNLKEIYDVDFAMAQAEGKAVFIPQIHT